MFPQLSPWELVLIMGVAVLLFGKKLPEVGRSLGKGIVEFKKGIRGIEEEVDTASTSSAYRSPSEDRTTSSASANVPRFEPPQAPPVSKPEVTANAYPD